MPRHKASPSARAATAGRQPAPTHAGSARPAAASLTASTGESHAGTPPAGSAGTPPAGGPHARLPAAPDAHADRSAASNPGAREPSLPEPDAGPPVPPASAAARPTAEAIAQDIALAIVERRLPPGTRLREEALGRVYAVSRTKIRAALLLLSKDKLIEIVPDKGACVSQPSAREAREVFAVRRLLESEVVRLFVGNARPAQYRMLEQHVRFERTTLSSAATGTLRERLLGDFHVQLAQAAGNAVLAQLVGELVARCSLIATVYESTNDSACSSNEHDEFLRVARSGDADAAVECMRQHLLRVEASLRLDAPPVDRHLDLVKALLT